MSDKKYYISKGMNLGQNQFADKDPELTNFEYQGTMQKVLENSEIVWKGLHAAGYMNYYLKNIDKNEKYNGYFNGNESTDEFLKKVLLILPKEMIKQKDKYVENVKKDFKPILSKIEELYKNSVEAEDVKQMDIVGNRVNLDNRKLLLHNIPMPSSLQDVEGRKDLGFLASEWFGKLEHRAEARFCCSFTKEYDLKPKKEVVSEDSKPYLTFIFDAESSKLKPLLRMDLFQYCRNKQKNELDKYKQEEKNILEKLLELSKTANYVAKDNPDWAAIPGGVSSNYVIGIIANNLKENSKEYDIALNVAELFNVPLIKPDLTLISENTLSL